jgi:hypothetical protein
MRISFQSGIAKLFANPRITFAKKRLNAVFSGDFFGTPFARTADVKRINRMKGPAMKTSQDAPVSGVYVSECCEVQLMFSEGNTLWRCPKCERLCNWDLMTTTMIANRLESKELVA